MGQGEDVWKTAKRSCKTLPCTATHNVTHCNTLQHAETYGMLLRALQHAATRCNALQHTATHCNTPQYTEAHCNAWLRGRATHRSHLLQCVVMCCSLRIGRQVWSTCFELVLMCCSVLQCIAVCLSVCIASIHVLQPHVLQRVAACCCHVLQRVAACCSVLQCIAVCLSVCIASIHVLQPHVLQRVVAMCCSVLQRVAVACLSICVDTYNTHTTYITPSCVAECCCVSITHICSRVCMFTHLTCVNIRA